MFNVYISCGTEIIIVHSDYGKVKNDTQTNVPLILYRF